jgi:nucleoside 2-deoxyribosyltransferase
VSEAPQATNNGRIPFRIRIGVTGHRDLEETPELVAAVRGQVTRVSELFHGSKTSIRLSVVSQLAEGADRLLVRQVRAFALERDQEARLEVFLPIERQEYVETQGFTGASREEFDRLFETATVRRDPFGARGEPERSVAFEATSQQVVDRCDLLIALWDGGKSGGRGGTAATLYYAASRSKPCIWISTDGPPSVLDNLELDRVELFQRKISRRAMPAAPLQPKSDNPPVDVLAALRDSFHGLEGFNRERCVLELGDDDPLHVELEAKTGVAAWAARPFCRATKLAGRWQRRFKRMARLITLFAALAAVMLAIGLSYGQETPAWTWAEAVFLSLALLGLRIVHQFQFHGSWLSYRVLAERLRTAHFLALTGADFPLQARLEAVYAGDTSIPWLVRAFEEVWDGRPQARPPASLSGGEIEQLTRTLAHEWIGGQIAYHSKMSHRHHRWHVALTGSVVVLFFAAIVVACLHSLGIWEEPSVFLSITLPAAGASLGVLLTLSQHRALSARYARMQTDLLSVKEKLLHAPPDSLNRASSEAARVMAQETGAWFGLMWFLDIEHP